MALGKNAGQPLKTLDRLYEAVLFDWHQLFPHFESVSSVPKMFPSPKYFYCVPKKSCQFSENRFFLYTPDNIFVLCCCIKVKASAISI